MVDPVPQLEDLAVERGTRVLAARRLQRAADATARSTTTCASPPRCRRSSGCAQRGAEIVLLLAPRAAEGQGRPEVLARAGRDAARRAARRRRSRSRPRSPGSSRCAASECLEPRRGDAAREPALRSGRRGERSRVRGEAHRARRRLRRRRVRRRAPCRTRRSSGRRVVLPSAAGRLLAREVEVLGGLLDAPQAPVRRHARRREGERQARRHRRAARTLRHAAHRRRDGVHVPRRAGRATSATRSCKTIRSSTAASC